MREFPQEVGDLAGGEMPKLALVAQPLTETPMTTKATHFAVASLPALSVNAVHVQAI
jgi:hypothetical protein